MRDGRGAPVPKAEVRVGDWSQLDHQHRRTDEAGEFRFVGLPIGEVKAFVEHDDFGKAIEQILAEPPFSNHRFQVLMGRANDPGIDGN